MFSETTEEGLTMKSFDEIQKMIETYEKTLAECNRVWELEKLSPHEKELSEQVDREFEAICDAVCEHISTMCENFTKIGIDLKIVDVNLQYKEPYHSFFARVGGNGYVGKHFVVPGFRYR
jgi:GTPase involved in cell partitioning and DNA repair